MRQSESVGLHVSFLLTAVVTIWESDEADKLIHVFSYFETAGFGQELYDFFIERALSEGGFLDLDVRSFLREQMGGAQNRTAQVQ